MRRRDRERGARVRVRTSILVCLSSAGINFQTRRRDERPGFPRGYQKPATWAASAASQGVYSQEPEPEPRFSAVKCGHLNCSSNHSPQWCHHLTKQFCDYLLNLLRYELQLTFDKPRVCQAEAESAAESANCTFQGCHTLPKWLEGNCSFLISKMKIVSANLPVLLHEWNIRKAPATENTAHLVNSAYWFLPS